VVVQGVADLAVIQPREIWLIDFKTDHLGPDSLGEKVKAYQPQLRLYAVALSRIYRRPVSSCWLYFLSRQTAVTVDTDPAENQ
jgi:ATP-dependent helicase/nuclease subunit A